MEKIEGGFDFWGCFDLLLLPSPRTSLLPSLKSDLGVSTQHLSWREAIAVPSVSGYKKVRVFWNKLGAA